MSRPYHSWSEVFAACRLRSHLCALADFSKTFFTVYRPPRAEHYRSSTTQKTENRKWSRQTTWAKKGQGFCRGGRGGGMGSSIGFGWKARMKGPDSWVRSWP